MRRIRKLGSMMRYGPVAVLVAIGANRRGAKQKVQELAGLVQLVRRQRPRRVLEIGTLHGGTLWAWCRVAHRHATIVSVDLPGGEFGGRALEPERVRRYARRRQKLRLLRADSHSPETLDAVMREFDGPIEFAFIDGDHSYAGVKRDFEMYGTLVEGIIAFHDTLPHDADTGSEVDRFWREVAPQYENLTFEDPSDTRWNGAWGGIGVLKTRSFGMN